MAPDNVECTEPVDSERSTQVLPVTAAILAGGRSQRMGVDKTLLTVEGRALVSRVADAVGSVCERTVVVTNNPEKFADAELPAGVDILVDEVPHQGPLGGLAAALKDATTEWVFLVAADTPHLEPNIVRALWDLRGDADAVIPQTEKGAEPLLALYKVSACAKPARDVLETGRRRVIAILPYIRVVEVPIDALRGADPELRSLVNINTPDDLRNVREGVDVAQDKPARKIEVLQVPVSRPRSMPSERPVTIMLNDVEIATTQATPQDLEELAVGYLVAEGFLTDRAQLVSVDADSKRGLVWVTSNEQAPDDLDGRTRYLTSGCGKGSTFASVGHARGLEPVHSDVTVTPDQIYDLVRDLSSAAALYRETGGMHAAGLAKGRNLVIAREDVGRHNAIDKVLGRAWLDGIAAHDGVLLATGRLSYEMALKAAKAGVPVAASRSAVTNLAADLADGLGVTLIGYARGGKITVFTHPERVVTPDGDGTDE